MDYYVIRNMAYATYLASIYAQSLAFDAEYFNAIRLTDVTMAEQFMAYCQAQEPDTEFKVYHVEVTLTEVNLTQVP